MPRIRLCDRQLKLGARCSLTSSGHSARSLRSRWRGRHVLEPTRRHDRPPRRAARIARARSRAHGLVEEASDERDIGGHPDAEFKVQASTHVPDRDPRGATVDAGPWRARLPRDGPATRMTAHLWCDPGDQVVQDPKSTRRPIALAKGFAGEPMTTGREAGMESCPSSGSSRSTASRMGVIAVNVWNLRQARAVGARPKMSIWRGPARRRGGDAGRFARWSRAAQFMKEYYREPSSRPRASSNGRRLGWSAIRNDRRRRFTSSSPLEGQVIRRRESYHPRSSGIMRCPGAECGVRHPDASSASARPTSRSGRRCVTEARGHGAGATPARFKRPRRVKFGRFPKTRRQDPEGRAERAYGEARRRSKCGAAGGPLCHAWRGDGREGTLGTQTPWRYLLVSTPLHAAAV